MVDRVSSYVISLGGDDSDLRSLFAGVKSRIRSDVAELKQITDKVELFSSITDNLPKVQQALDSAKSKVQQFTAEIQKIEDAGGKAPKALTDALAQAEKAAASATKEFNNQQQKLASLDSQLTRAGVNTRSLASEQTRLADAAKAAAAAAEVQAAKQQLGLVTLKDTQGQAAKLQSAFDTLKASGTLSATETAAAQKLLDAELKSLSSTVTKTGTSFVGLKDQANDALAPMKGQALAAIAAVSGLAATFSSITAAAREYRQGLAEASAGTDLTKESVGALGKEALQLASDLGVDANEAVRGLFALLRAGLPEDNAIDTLRIAGEAAKASMSDLGTGVKITKLLINDFKVAPGDLGHAFDVLSKSIGATKGGFEAFAESSGPLLAVARASGVGLEDLAQILKAMQKGGIEAGQAMGDLTKIIISLGDDKALASLHGIGVTATDLTGIFTQLRDKGASLQDVIDLTGVSKKSAAAIATLINNGITPLGDASDTVSKKIAKLYDTPKEITDRFHATIDVTKIKLGELVVGSGQVVQGITLMLGAFNQLVDAGKTVDGATENSVVRIAKLAVTVYNLKQAHDAQTESAAKSAKQTADGETGDVRATKAVQDHTAAREALRKSLEVNGAALLQYAKDLLAVTEGEVKAVEDQAQREIAATELVAGARRRQTDEERKAFEAGQAVAALTFDLSTRTITAIGSVAEARANEAITAKQAAEQIIATKDKAAKDELAIIVARERQITEATDTALAARLKSAGASSLKLKEFEDDRLKVQTDSTQKIIALYQGLYDRLYKEARAGQDKINAIDAERIGFNEQIATKLRDLRNAGLSDAEKYSQTIRDIDVATSKARQALSDGDLKVGKQYTDEAIKLAESLSKVTTDEGQVVVSNLEVQQTKIRVIKGAADQYNEALKDQGDAAKEGVDKSKSELEKVTPILDDLREKLTILRTQLSDKIIQQINVELSGVDTAREIIRELVKPQTKVITVETVTKGGGGTGTGTGGSDAGGGGGNPEPGGIPLAAGGFVPRWKQYAQAFADGGSVFRRPNWSKVPGVGNGDTVPALLQEGSFVVKKAASQLYGDDFMSRVARGYADGGAVDKVPKSAITQILNYAQHIMTLARHPMFALIVEAMGQRIRAIQSNISIAQKNVIAKELLEDARAIARNFHLIDFYGVTTVSPGNSTGDLPDFKWAEGSNTTGFAAGGAVLRQMAALLAGGGSVGTDTVPAMLTPGEWVVPKPVVDRLGGNFLQSLNNMLIPPRPKYLATGGSVGDVSRAPIRAPSFGGLNIEKIEINAAGGKLDDPKVLRRLRYELEKVMDRRD